MLIVGSRALAIIAPHLLDREPRDWDFVATAEEAEAWVAKHRDKVRSVEPADRGKKLVVRGAGQPVEFELAWPGSTAEELISIVRDETCAPQHATMLGVEVIVPSLNVLFALKTSHRFLRNSPYFAKTMRDWRAMREAGAVVEDLAWLKRREAETYWYKHPKLNVEKSEFFAGDGVKYVYDHDAIHEAVKHLERPAYTYFKPADKPVLCDRAMFWAAGEQTRLCSVVEEAYVLAIERSQVPHPSVLTPRQSFMKALEKVCTSITSGWWREYAYEHYHEAVALYSDDYTTKFWTAVAAGRVPPHSGKTY